MVDIISDSACNSQAVLTIDEYIIKNNLILSDNDIFLELWIPLFNKKEILITEKLLEFMGFGDNNNGHSGTR